jgi:hypothetical protein
VTRQTPEEKMSGMNSQSAGLRFAALLFAVFAIGHVIRLVKHINVTVGSLHVPFAVSWVALIIAGALAIWMWRLSAR